VPKPIAGLLKFSGFSEMPQGCSFHQISAEIMFA
jgi:hypothetical protein